MRYWKIIVLTIIVVFSIGTYYVQNVFAKPDYPEFHLEKVSGDEDVVDGLLFMANYFDMYKEITEGVKITSEDTIYQSELSYFDYLSGVFQEPTINRLQSDYRSFMRGKDGDIGTLFEDDKRLIYAGPFGIESDDSIKIEILDKETNETTGFEVEISKNNFNYINVVDVQANQKDIILITRNYYPNDSETEEGYHVYRINIENESLISNEVIYKNKADHTNKTWTQLSEVNNYNDIEKEEYFVMRLDHMEDGDEYESFEVANSEFFAYQVETNELKELKLPDELLSMEKTAYVHGGGIYFLNKTKSGFELIRYQLDDGKLNTIEVPTTLDLYEGNIYVIFHDGKMYISNSGEEGTTNLFVLDEETGKLVYEGKIDADRELENVHLDLYEVAVE
jgi:hypothetical protein